MPAHLALNYKGPTQKVRVVTETWGRDNLYCPNCQSSFLTPTPPGTAAIDYVCPSCGLPFQLKSRSKPIISSLRDAAYDAMMRAINENRTPNLYALHYDRLSWRVLNLILIPHFALTASAILKTPPSKPQKRKNPWVGCNISLINIPLDAKIRIVSDGIQTPPNQVRESFRRIRPLKELDVKERGWTLDVLRVVRSLGKTEFSNTDVYAFVPLLERLHPENHRVREKIRQQLQVLRDKGLLIHVERGVWALKE
jgi:type II restriction enzyme